MNPIVKSIARPIYYKALENSLGKKSINFLNTFDYNFYRHFDLTNAGFCGMIMACITLLY